MLCPSTVVVTVQEAIACGLTHLAPGIHWRLDGTEGVVANPFNALTVAII